MKVLFIFFTMMLFVSDVYSSTEVENPQGNQQQDNKKNTQKGTQLEGLLDLSLEELINIDITSVSKREQKLLEAPAAIFVITQEDIKRSGATSIPELLKMAPGIEVARIDTNKWAISARGFNSRFANKLLVLIDGRSVYTPLFSGVYWDAQDILLEDIERIEVIRGPGATLWGANAVNGVINVITKKAKDTQGMLVTGGAGDEELGFGAFRYGNNIGKDISFRVYGKYFERDDAKFSTSEGAFDSWDSLRGGFRLDWQLSSKDSLTVEGDIYENNLGQTTTIPIFTAPYYEILNVEDSDINGDNVLGRWEHAFSIDSKLMTQLYYDQNQWTNAGFAYDRETIDFELQHQFILTKRNAILWGAGYRFTNDYGWDSFTMALSPESHEEHLFSAFLQDEITLVQKELKLTIGSKIEHNNSTDVELQPNVRLMWTPNDRHSLWAAVSHAVRTPSRGENDIRLNTSIIAPGTLFDNSPVALIAFYGNRDFESEELNAYEFGYRILVSNKLSFDIATFYNEYDELRSVEQLDSFLTYWEGLTYLTIPYSFVNSMYGKTYGVELSASWQPTNWWRLSAAYSYLQMELYLDEASGINLPEITTGESPHHQLSLRSSFDITKRIQFDWWLRYVDSLPALDIDSYTALDCRLAWNPIKNIELSVTGQNLTDNQHPEFKQEMFVNSSYTEVERSVYLKFTWRSN